MRGVELIVDGRTVTVSDERLSLLEVIRDLAGARSAKDGCSPQGQCGCCTVLVDGQPRMACVTPARRVAGRSVTTADGLDPARLQRWADAFACTGASQCGFCTPGIVVRLDALCGRGPADTVAVRQALLAHLCRCTGWQTILEAAAAFQDGAPLAARDPEPAARRAGLEGRAMQRSGPEIALGRGGFADDTAPPDSLVAVPDASGGWAVAETLGGARSAAGKVQGRHSTERFPHPVALPNGDWDLTLQTGWVEPGYLEPDASWCAPGGDPASPLANGGAFGGKVASPLPQAARALAAEHGRTVRAVWSREDVVRLGPKRPPLSAGIDRARRRIEIRVARTRGVAEALLAGIGAGASVAIDEVDVAGPPTSLALRAAGWAEGVVLRQALGDAPLGWVTHPEGGRAAVEWSKGVMRVRCDGGEPLDEVVVRSYVIGAVHQALGWVCSEGIGVGTDGVPADLTIRSFGILRAVDTPPIEVVIEPSGGPAVNVSDAVFAAVAAEVWRLTGFPATWPSGRRLG
jgi:aerobic-type carbon monoxide dehydrogenase small subunit (CoxS/CutS family)